MVNNGAAALVLAATALAAGREIVLSRGELVEIGDGFRIPDLLVSTGARLREVGTTNRITPGRLRRRGRPGDRFRAQGAPVQLRGHRLHLQRADRGAGDAAGVRSWSTSAPGCSARCRALPDEPDAASALRAGAALVTASGDKLLGGPQAGLLLGRRRRGRPAAPAPAGPGAAGRQAHPGRAGGDPARPGAADRAGAARPTRRRLRERADRLAALLRASGVDAEAVDSSAAVGGGGAPGVTLPSAAVSLPAPYADRLRTGDPAVVGRVERGRCLLDLRCVERDRRRGAPPRGAGRIRHCGLTCTSSPPPATSTTASRRWCGR